jgi:adenylate kinase
MLLKKLLAKDCSNGFILDGFPRSLSRARILKEYILNASDKVNIFVLKPENYEILHERLSKRLICDSCHIQYNISELTKLNCPKCKKSLNQRSDDTQEKFAMKMKMYENNINEITKYLSNYPSHYITFSKFDNAKDINKFILNTLKYGIHSIRK